MLKYLFEWRISWRILESWNHLQQDTRQFGQISEKMKKWRIRELESQSKSRNLNLQI